MKLEIVLPVSCEAYHTFYAVEHLLDLLLAALTVDAHPQGQSLETQNKKGTSQPFSQRKHQSKYEQQQQQVLDRLDYERLT